jgi:hypothetical protein
MFDSRNNYKNQISSIILYHEDKPISEFDYFLQGKSKYIFIICLSQISNSEI